MVLGKVIWETQKMVLDATLLNTQHYKISIKGKVEESKEEVAPSSTPWHSSYWKGSLQVTLDKGRQFYLYKRKLTYVVHSISFQIFLYRHLKLSETLENSACYCYTTYKMTDQFLWFQAQLNSYSSNWNTPY